MTPDEFVLIKWCVFVIDFRLPQTINGGLSLHSGDSITDGSVALCTPHTAFIDPTTPADAKPRESIEIRALVFYD
jgi:hypothetical protein